MQPNHTRRLTPAEIQDRLPKILGEHRTKTDERTARAEAARQAEEDRRAAQKALTTARNVKIGQDLASKFRKAVAKGTRFRAGNGRFLSVAKVA